MDDSEVINAKDVNKAVKPEVKGEKSLAKDPQIAEKKVKNEVKKIKEDAQAEKS